MSAAMRRNHSDVDDSGIGGRHVKGLRGPLGRDSATSTQITPMVRRTWSRHRLPVSIRANGEAVNVRSFRRAEKRWFSLGHHIMSQ